MAENKMNVRIILEVLGRPPENVSEALTLLAKNIEQEKGVKVLEVTQHAPVPVQESKNLFTAFSELNLEIESLHILFTLLFKYMPANIEFTYPEKIVISNQDLNAALNQLVQRLHHYDAIAKNVMAEREFVFTKLHEIAPEALKKLIQLTSPPTPELPKEEKQEKKKKVSKKKRR